jgi:hypothetical protein
VISPEKIFATVGIESCSGFEAELLRLYEIATGQIAAGTWKTVAGAAVLTPSE